MDQGKKDAPALVRRRRKVARQTREKTPEPQMMGDTRKYSDEESSSTADQGNAQTYQMQIKPPGSVSAHKSKILSRRNKSFTGYVARSQSQPRSETAKDDNSAPEIQDLLRSARRSLSSPRHKGESTGSSHPSKQERGPPPSPPNKHSDKPTQFSHSADEKELSRLEINLRKFEEERRRFDLEKKRFELEKRELDKLRYRRLHSNEDKKRIFETYRRLSDRINLPSDSDERQKLVRSFKREQHDVPAKQRSKSPVRYVDYESSTAATSSSDGGHADLDDEENIPRPQTTATNTITTEPTLPNRRSTSTSPLRKIIQKPAQPTESTQPAQPIEEPVVKMETKPLLEEPPAPITKSEEKPTMRNFLLKLIEKFSRKTKQIKEIPTETETTKIETIMKPESKQTTWSLLKLFMNEARIEWTNLVAKHPNEIEKMRLQRNKCICQLIIIALFCGFGGLMFRFTEGNFENTYKCGVRKVKRDFIDQLWLSSHNQREEDWKSAARTKLRKFEEELEVAHEAGVTSYSGSKSWSFVNSVVYCLTIITTIGYGHIAAKTTLGQAITIIYAIIGIPLFLILLADFGKLFTRGIKFVWAYVRRLYYTGSCRQVRKQAQVQEVMRGMSVVYDYAIRRPSMFIRDPNVMESGGSSGDKTPDVETHVENSETPTTPYPETIEIDDEFNLPVSLATTILILYIFFGASVCWFYQHKIWTYFESFYFVFISMSTIGFGDLVPREPIFMVCSILYLVFGLALTSMCINVVQLKLSDSFKHASAKIGATIGLTMAEEESKMSQSQCGTPIEIASVHSGPIKLHGIPESDFEDSNINITVNNNYEDLSSPPPLLPKKSSLKTDINSNKK